MTDAQPYNGQIYRGLGSVGTGNLLFLILDDAYVPNPAHDTVADVAAHEVTGAGYARATVTATAVFDESTGIWRAIQDSTPVIDLSAVSNRGFLVVARDGVDDAARKLVAWFADPGPATATYEAFIPGGIVTDSVDTTASDLADHEANLHAHGLPSLADVPDGRVLTVIGEQIVPRPLPAGGGDGTYPIGGQLVEVVDGIADISAAPDAAAYLVQWESGLSVNLPDPATHGTFWVIVFDGEGGMVGPASFTVDGGSVVGPIDERLGGYGVMVIPFPAELGVGWSTYQFTPPRVGAAAPLDLTAESWPITANLTAVTGAAASLLLPAPSGVTLDDVLTVTVPPASGASTFSLRLVSDGYLDEITIDIPGTDQANAESDPFGVRTTHSHVQEVFLRTDDQGDGSNIWRALWMPRSVSGGGGDAIPSSWVDTDGTMAANSDTHIATQKATRTYVAAEIADLGLGNSATKNTGFTSTTVALGSTAPSVKVLAAARTTGSTPIRTPLVPVVGGATTVAIAAGTQLFGRANHSGQTVVDLYVIVSASSLSAGQTIEVACYNDQGDWTPGTRAWAQTLTVGTSTGNISASSLSLAMPAGACWLAVLNPSGNAGSVTLRSGTPTMSPAHTSMQNGNWAPVLALTSVAASSSDASSYLLRSSSTGSTVFGVDGAATFPILGGSA